LVVQITIKKKVPTIFQIYGGGLITIKLGVNK